MAPPRNKRLSNPIINARGDQSFKPAGEIELQMADAMVGMLDNVVAAAQEIRNVGDQIKIQNSRLDTLLGVGPHRPGRGGGPGGGGPSVIDYDQLQAAVSRGMADVVSSVISTGIQAYNQATGGAGGPVGTTSPSTAAAASAGGIAPTSRGATGRLRDAGGESPSTTNFQDYRGVSIKGLRQEVGRKVSEYQPRIRRYEQVSDPTSKTGVRWIDNATNSEIAADSPEIAKAMRYSKLTGAVKGKVGSVLEADTLGEGVMNLLPKGAGAAIGTVGAVAQAADKVADFAVAQRQANLNWQRVSGESNFSGFRERGRAKMFELESKFGGIGAGTAAEMYGEVQNLGLRGQRREMGLDFMSDQYRRLGMNAQESGELLRISLENGQEGLVGLSQALDQVTTAAKDASMNAVEMRKNFTDTFRALAGQVTAPGQAAALAAGVTTAQAGLGHNLQDVRFSGMFGETQGRQQAQLLGLSYGEFMARGAEAGGAQLRAAGAQALAQQRANMAIGPRGQEVIRNFLREANVTSMDQLTPDQRRQLGIAITRAAPDPRQLTAFLSSAGIEADQMDAGQVAAEVATGHYDPWGKTAENEARSGYKKLSGGELKKVRQERASYLSAAGTRGRLGDTARYDTHVLETGKESSIVRGLLDKGNYDPSRRYLVNVRGPDGKITQREVNLGEGLEHFSEQFERGEVQIAKGSNAGSTVADALGMTTNTAAKDVTDATGKNKGLLKVGKAAEGVESEGGVKGEVLIKPSAELMRLLDLVPSGAGVRVQGGGSTEPGAQSFKWRPSGN